LSDDTPVVGARIAVIALLVSAAFVRISVDVATGVQLNGTESVSITGHAGLHNTRVVGQMHILRAILNHRTRSLQLHFLGAEVRVCDLPCRRTNWRFLLAAYSHSTSTHNSNNKSKIHALSPSALDEAEQLAQPLTFLFGFVEKKSAIPVRE